MQTVLVTGATSGIGLPIANQLHDNGFKVFGTSRFPDQHRAKAAFDPPQPSQRRAINPQFTGGFFGCRVVLPRRY